MIIDSSAFALSLVLQCSNCRMWFDRQGCTGSTIWQKIISYQSDSMLSKYTPSQKSDSTSLHSLISLVHVQRKKMMSPLLTLKHTHYRLDLLVQFYCPWQTGGQAISHRASSHCFLIQTVRGWHLRPVYGILSYLTFSSAKPEQVKVYSSPVTCTHLLRTKAKSWQREG